MSNLIVIVDADAIVAQAYPADSNHQKAVEISNRLIELKATVIYPALAVLEATTVLQAKLNSGVVAFGTAVTFTEPGVKLAEVNQKVIQGAVELFSPRTSKKNTLFDCVVAAVAKEAKADAIFSFDGFYKKKGFKLASEL